MSVLTGQYPEQLHSSAMVGRGHQDTQQVTNSCPFKVEFYLLNFFRERKEHQLVVSCIPPLALYLWPPASPQGPGWQPRAGSRWGGPGRLEEAMGSHSRSARAARPVLPVAFSRFGALEWTPGQRTSCPQPLSTYISEWTLDGRSGRGGRSPESGSPFCHWFSPGSWGRALCLTDLPTGRMKGPQENLSSRSLFAGG